MPYSNSANLGLTQTDCSEACILYVYQVPQRPQINELLKQKDLIIMQTIPHTTINLKKCSTVKGNCKQANAYNIRHNGIKGDDLYGIQ